MYNEPLTFTVDSGKSADTRVFRLQGPVTLGNMFEFQKALLEKPPKLTIVDLTETPYMDSAGLGVLLNYYVSGKRHGREIRAVSVNYRVAALFELSGVQTLIKSYDSVEAAESAAS